MNFTGREWYCKITPLPKVNKAPILHLHKYKMSFLIKRIIGKNNHNTNSNKTSSVKCKECGMMFEEKGRLEIHRKKAHSGKGERKKSQSGMH